MQYSDRIQKLEDHLKKEHRLSPISTYLKEVVYGGVDGIITTFAVVAGFSGAAVSASATSQLSFLLVLLFGLANLFADGVSMGLGNFLGVRADQRLYKKIKEKELYEIINDPESEHYETVTILLKRGFNEGDAEQMALLYRKNQAYWTDFMMSHELEMSNPTTDNPILTALATFLAFILFGFIPLIPFIVLGSADPQTVFWFSALGTFVALLLLGVLKWRVIKEGLLRSVIEIVLVGGVAASVAFFVGSLFSF